MLIERGGNQRKLLLVITHIETQAYEDKCLLGQLAGQDNLIVEGQRTAVDLILQ